MAYRQKIFAEWTHAHEAARRGRKTSALSVFALAHLADMMLRVELKPEPADEIELRFEEIDVVFLVRHQLLEQVACHIVLRGVAVRRGFLVERAGGNLRRQVAVKHLFDVLTDAEGIEQLQIRETFEENDTHEIPGFTTKKAMAFPLINCVIFRRFVGSSPCKR